MPRRMPWDDSRARSPSSPGRRAGRARPRPGCSRPRAPRSSWPTCSTTRPRPWPPSIGDAARCGHLDVTDEDAWKAGRGRDRGGLRARHHRWSTTPASSPSTPSTSTTPTEFRTRPRRQPHGLLPRHQVRRARRCGRPGSGSIVNISSNGGMEGLPVPVRLLDQQVGASGASPARRPSSSAARASGSTPCTPAASTRPMTRFEGVDQTTGAAFYQNLPIKRVGTVDDVAPVVLFLCQRRGRLRHRRRVRRRRRPPRRRRHAGRRLVVL